MPKPPPMSPTTTRNASGLRLEHCAEKLARAGRRLVLGVERGAPALEHADAGARLHRHGDDALVMQFEFRDVRRRGDLLFDESFVSIRGFRGDVAARLLPDERRTGRGRAPRVDHAGELLVFDRGELGGILRRFARAGDHGEHRLSRVVRLALGERRARRRRHRRAVGALEERRKRDRPDAVGRELGHGPDREHAFGIFRGGHVHRDDARMRVRRAHEDEPRRVRKRAVVAEYTLPLQEAIVLQALLGARGAEACGRRIELDVQVGDAHPEYYAA